MISDATGSTDLTFSRLENAMIVERVPRVAQPMPAPAPAKNLRLVIRDSVAACPPPRTEEQIYLDRRPPQRGDGRKMRRSVSGQEMFPGLIGQILTERNSTGSSGWARRYCEPSSRIQARPDALHEASHRARILLSSTIFLRLGGMSRAGYAVPASVGE